MDESERAAFENQFGPVRIGGFELLTEEVVGVHVSHDGFIDCPIYPPDDGDDGDDVEASFLLRLSPMEARNLAGLLVYAAGRADETSDHCVGCGGAVDDKEVL